MFPQRIFLASLLIVALLTAGCGETIRSYGELMALEIELKDKFGDEVSVTVKGDDYGVILVYFLNSPLNDVSAEQRMKRAAEAAKVVKETYPHMQNVRGLWVGFLREKTRFAVFHHNQIVALHGFAKDGSPLPGQNDDREHSTELIQVNVTYDDDKDESDVSVNGVQLDGKPGGLGLTVLPFFKVRGDARGGARRPPPKNVSLNFASYAEKTRFAQTVPISFVAEGKVVLQTDGTFTGNDTQFCYLTIPYKEFRRIVDGKELILKLGDTGYPVTPSQLGAMKHMTDFVTQ